MEKTIVIFLITFWSGVVGAQIGGRYAYEFSGLPASSRLTALGGHLISVIDGDVNLAMSNPASINAEMHNAIAFNHNFHFAGISNGHFAVGQHFDKLGLSSHIAVSYINYGDFTGADRFGNLTNDFKATEKMITLGASKSINQRISVGANLKSIFSNLDVYNSFGMAVDLGVNYINSDDRLIISFVIKNLGGEISSYTADRTSAPLDIQMGISKRLKYLPFRFSIIAHQLQQWDIKYDDPAAGGATDIFGNPIDVEQGVLARELDNLFRHLIFNGEFLLGKNENFRLRFGYNHHRRKELSLSNFRSLAGFSLGFGLKISKFRLDYGVGYHHLAGAANHLSISTNFDQFKKKVSL